MKDKLAVFGGKPVRSRPFEDYNPLGDKEVLAAVKVVKSGVLSQFLGCWHPDFYGGPMVRRLERDWARYTKTKYAVSVNSCTSGLYAACGAVGVGPGDEVIVSPYTMSASAACVLGYNAIPVFADVDHDTFCITPKSIAERITPRTKAIVVVNIMGHPADMDEIMKIARKHGLKVIEDCAQAPGAEYKGKKCGAIGHIGVFSLNYHKHIHTGEGGICVTSDKALAERLQLIRNHAEAVAEDMGAKNLVNLLGFNYRMTEIEAAIGIEQLKKLDSLIAPRIKLANYLTNKFGRIDGLTPPLVKRGAKHVYYIYAIKYDEKATGIPRDKFAKAVEAEGIPVSQGYVRPLYLQPLYQQLTVYGKKGCPFTCSFYKGKTSYRKGICPVTEKLYEKELLYISLMRPPLTKKDMDDVVEAFAKVMRHVKELKSLK